MNRETISDNQGICLIVLFTIGTTFIFVPGIEAGKDAALALFFSVMLAFPLMLIYSRILYLFPEKDLFDIVILLFGKVLGKIIALFFFILPSFLGILIFHDLAAFINNASLPETQPYVFMLFFGVLCIWIVKEGIEVIGNFAQFFFVANFVVTITTLLLLTVEFDINNIKPMFENGYKPFLKGTFDIFTFPYTEFFIFTMAFSTFTSRKSPYKIFIKGLVMGGALGTIFTLFIVGVLGVNETTTCFFPAFIMAKRITISPLAQGVEVVFILAFVISGFVKLSICVLASSKGISKIFNFTDYRFIVVPIVLLSISFATFIFEDTKEMLEWTKNIWDYFAFPFQVVMPILVLIVAEVNRRRNTKDTLGVIKQ